MYCLHLDIRLAIRDQATVDWYSFENITSLLEAGNGHSNSQKAMRMADNN